VKSGNSSPLAQVSSDEVDEYLKLGKHWVRWKGWRWLEEEDEMGDRNEGGGETMGNVLGKKKSGVEGEALTGGKSKKRPLRRKGGLK